MSRLADRRLTLMGGPEEGDGAVVIQQEQRRLWRAAPAARESVDVALAPGRHAWVQVTRGKAAVNEVALATGDGAAISGETALVIAAQPRATNRTAGVRYSP